ncbi:ribonuclease H-like domain-containing protein [Vulgatibacter incomptus]|uniref:YprB ribonuclease H-like domain-containing protein n=1 Tax=Vulgatibacter incomptus TaxID=1391653 RepID=A0A0K1PBP8_9BACT|nr:ribonuclease H-like domain-containing protein [Vulgatibacter incomptus]AKU90950.1 hypothetical protein AKJ08_1337 [Vulgatibacter incomptus]
MITSTFRGLPGIGPSRERELWAKGIRSWNEVPRSGVLLSPRLDDGLRRGIDELQALFEEGDVRGLARRISPAEHWRLWPWALGRTCFLDIETDGFTDVVTSVAVHGEDGPRAFVRGVSMNGLGEMLEGYDVVVTFNGASFDLPVLRRAFPGLPIPPVHVDLRSVFKRLGEQGGLKKIEARLGLTRPGEVEGVDGYEAVRLWHRWDDDRDLGALCTLVEYNLYDAIQLRPLFDIGYNRLVEQTGLPIEPVRIYERGDVLYDVSKILGELRSRF